jgi:hypothetical protein
VSDKVKIEVLEETGIRTQKYGHMLKEEQKFVDREDAELYCGNGWAKDLSPENPIPTGERGSLDTSGPMKVKGK